MYDEPQDLVMEITNFLFYGILNREVHTMKRANVKYGLSAGFTCPVSF